MYAAWRRRTVSGMLLVAIPALDGTASIGTAGLLDALNKADASWALRGGAGARRLFDVRLVGLSGRPVVCRDGIRLHPGALVRNLPTPDLVVVPGLDDDLAASFELNRRWVPWISRWHEAGARIASSCTGVPRRRGRGTAWPSSYDPLAIRRR